MVVNINGKDYELHFGMSAVTYFYEKVGELSEGEPYKTNVMAELLWGALENGAYAQRKTLTIPFVYVLEFVEEALYNEERNALLLKIQDEFANSKFVKGLQEKMKTEQPKEVEEIKKNEDLTLTNSKPSASDASDGQNTSTVVAHLEPSY